MTTKTSTRKRTTLLAVGAGVAVTAISLASAAGLGGLRLDRIGAENGVVADPFSDGVTVEWGAPVYDTASGQYVVEEFTVSRAGVTSLHDGTFSALRDSGTTGVWFTTDALNPADGSAALSADGLELTAPHRVDSDAPHSKAGALYFTGITALTDLNLGAVEVDFTGLAGSVNNVLVQIPVYVGPDAEDIDVVEADNAARSPIFSTPANAALGGVLNPVSGMTRTADEVTFDENTVFNLMPRYTGSLGVDGDNMWNGTLSEFLAAYPNAVTPGLWVNLSSNASTSDDTAFTVTDVSFGASSWSFAPSPAFPAGELRITVADASGASLQEGIATTDGTVGSVTFALTDPLPATDIRNVAIVVHGIS